MVPPFSKTILRLFRDRRGGSQAEYALLLALVAAGGTIAFGAAGPHISAVYEHLAASLPETGGQSRIATDGGLGSAFERPGVVGASQEWAPGIDISGRSGPEAGPAETAVSETMGPEATTSPGGAAPAVSGPAGIDGRLSETDPPLADAAATAGRVASKTQSRLRDLSPLASGFAWGGLLLGPALLLLSVGLMARRRRRLIASLRRL